MTAPKPSQKSHAGRHRRGLRTVLGVLFCTGLFVSAHQVSVSAPRRTARPAPRRLAPRPAAPAPNPLVNWPQWRGPMGDGTAPKADPPVAWSETSNIAWKVKLPGSGTATPIIWEDKVFIQTAVLAMARPTPENTPPPPTPPTAPPVDPAAPPAPATTPAQPAQPPVADPAQPVPPPGVPGTPGEMPPRRGRGPGGFGGMRATPPTEAYRFTLVCLGRKTGKTLWQKVAREEIPHEGHHPDHGFSSHSPVTDGKHVYAYFGSRGLHCFDMTGKLKWSKDLGRMQTKLSFGEGSSPSLAGNSIIVTWDHEGEDFIVAFDKTTGSERWRQPREEDTSWATPFIVKHGGQTQVITSATRKIRSYDADSGKLLWEAAGMTSNPIPTPVAGNGMVYATSGFRGSSLMAIKLGREGDLTGTDAIAWTHNRNTPYVPSPLLAGNRLYFFSSNTGILSAFDAVSGQPVIDAARLDALVGVYASPVYAAGRVYLVGRNGAVVVLKQSDTLEVLATNKLEERFDASPAIAGKQLFLRGKEYLYCIAEKPAAPVKPAAAPRARARARVSRPAKE